MFTTILIAALLSAPEVRIAPDQPLPYVFSDEPVIVEFRSDEAIDFDVMIVYGTGQFPTNSHGLGPIALRADQPYWTTTNLDPVRFGVHSITLNLQWPTGSEKYTFTLQRIRRPDADAPPPLMVRIPNRPGPWDQIVRVLPASRVSIPSDHPDMAMLLDTFARDGVSTRVLLRGNELTRSDASASPTSIAIPAADSIETWVRTAHEMRERFPTARIVLDDPSPEFLLALLRAGGVQLINAVSVDSIDELVANRLAAEQQGYESLPFSVYTPAADLMQASAAWNAGAYVAEISIDPLWYENTLTAEFGMLNAAIHLFDDVRVAGRYEDAETVILRDITPDHSGRWLAPVTRPVPIPSLSEYGDEHGNLHPDPPADIAYALGDNVDTVLEAIAFEVRQEAAVLKGIAGVLSGSPDEFARAVDRLTNCRGTESMRTEFFALLRALPRLEEAWHTGDLRKSSAVPALASIERLVRRLGALEQTLNIPFVEPFEETLDRCAEQQALYLTATLAPGASAERGESLVVHISTLINQARILHRQGRTIEADALAALAEWRARSLVHTVKARPLTEVERERVPGG